MKVRSTEDEEEYEERELKREVQKMRRNTKKVNQTEKYRRG